ncbi:methylated-DNA--[protein]-cysteine S-methyltransferase [Granulosicoccus antarcticus]|uniref:Methylated-DNA--protein-cysteine methyltransferase n=1 Tax=Granulosicoccus antarcticus IMCC3135 TaxID=1192854 RepID=A0A2Z2P3N5_9GAMM|nr:methylated-DNA--[protein]-cysteine S-methyltransferase [Granulosicoccus antarcticus]ASJ75237.1 Methylated-DNA--protein-cysteine methyltransferase [Granulosicoccus antarcticus IMCC3135]
MYTTTHDTVIGTLTLAGDHTGLRHLIFPQGDRAFHVPEQWQSWSEPFDRVRWQLDEYFSGSRQKFSVTLAPTGTLFQMAVWQALGGINYANTCSYGHIAKSIGKPKASRAVGAANGANPIPIIIPCHRVIGASGKLTGFGGGLPTKQWLLVHETGEGQLFGVDPTIQEYEQRNQA